MMINKENKMQIQLKGYDSIIKNIRAYGHSGGVVVPKLWIKGTVRVILIDNNDYGIRNIQGRQKRKTEIPSEKQLFKELGYDSVIKTVIKQGGSGYIHLPQRWIGKLAKIILIKNPEKKVNDSL